MSRRRSGRSIVLAASVFAALGDATRLELVTRLNDGGARSIAQLAEGLDLTRQDKGLPNTSASLSGPA